MPASFYESPDYKKKIDLSTLLQGNSWEKIDMFGLAFSLEKKVKFNQNKIKSNRKEES